MTIGKNLMRLRSEKGISQYEVAARLGIQRARYNSWEQGIANPRSDMLGKLAEFFGVTPDELLGYESQQTPSPAWAKPKDIRDIKKILEEDLPVMFDGKPVNDEDRQRIADIITGFLWDAKEMNKKTYGRKRDTKNGTSDDTNKK